MKKWIGITLGTVGAVAGLAACGSSVSGPSTQVHILNIGATLPGEDWHKVSTEKVGGVST